MDDSTPSKRDGSPLDFRRPIQPDIRKHGFPSPAFGKTAIQVVILVIVVVAYMYQVCLMCIYKSLSNI